MTDRGEFTPEGIRFERQLPAPPGEIWEAITGPDRLAEWLERTDLARRVGGSVTVHFEGSPVTGKVQVWEPPSVLEYTWVISGEIESVVRFELEPDNGGTRLRLFHRALPADQAAGYAPGWHAYLDRLAAMIQGKPLPDWESRFVALRPEYQRPRTG
jgi:uncharacterized protein YndB with AHSA1/START domain